MSDKMLYNEVKAEQQFLTLINATVSHELRNPLASLIGQRDSLKGLLKQLLEVITYCKKKSANNREVIKISGILEKIHEGLGVCTKKIVSSSKFIDYFVHDMLDYSILNKEEKNFMKSADTFDVRKAIGEIIEIQEDKILMKNLEVEQVYKGFENVDFKVRTDQKRIQQVFLNIFSNAVKFTDRGGKILILVEL